MINKLAEKVLFGEDLKQQDANYLIDLNAKLDELFFYANKIRDRKKGRLIKLCSIINAKSGGCNEDCKFCAQSVHYNTKVAVYPLKDSSEIFNSAKESAKAGISGFSIVTSGNALNKQEINSIGNAVKKINNLDIYACASLGKLNYEDAVFLKQSGLKRYHHNLETSKRFFKNICSTHTYDEKIQTINNAKKAGLEICCGGVFGIGETNDDIIDMIFTLRELNVDSVPLNFLNPRPGTPLGSKEMLSPVQALKIISVFRFLLPDKDITICGGRNVVLRELQSWVFYAGANGIMTGNYLTTPGRSHALDLQMINDLGLAYE